MKRIPLFLFAALAIAACDSPVPTGSDGSHAGSPDSVVVPIATPTKPTTTSTSGGNIGDPCDPETYDGPYRCVPDSNSVSGYAIAN
jgi:hypothetical protein